MFLCLDQGLPSSPVATLRFSFPAAVPIIPLPVGPRYVGSTPGGKILGKGFCWKTVGISYSWKPVGQAFGELRTCRGDYKPVPLFPLEDDRRFLSSGKMPVSWIADGSEDGTNKAGNPPESGRRTPVTDSASTGVRLGEVVTADRGEVYQGRPRSERSVSRTDRRVQSSFSMGRPSRNSCMGRPVGVVSSRCGSMPRRVKMVAPRSSGVQGSVAGAMPEASVLPWT